MNIKTLEKLNKNPFYKMSKEQEAEYFEKINNIIEIGAFKKQKQVIKKKK